jgi:N-methylhydantoinase B/oxoprolinase/acetone carboxylase alpha subunit
LKLLEYCYCDKFVESMTPNMVRSVSELCKPLGLNNLHILMKKKFDFARNKIHAQVVKEMQGQNSSHELSNFTAQHKKAIRLRVEQIEQTLRLDFQTFEEGNGGNV